MRVRFAILTLILSSCGPEGRTRCPARPEQTPERIGCVLQQHRNLGRVEELAYIEDDEEIRMRMTNGPLRFSCRERRTLPPGEVARDQPRGGVTKMRKPVALCDDARLGSVTFEDERWVAGARVGDIGKRRAKSGHYMVETGTVLTLALRNSEAAGVRTKAAAGDYERVVDVLGTATGQACVLTHMRRGPCKVRWVLYEVTWGGWSEPLLTTELSGYVSRGKTVWFVEPDGIVRELSLGMVPSVTKHVTDRGPLRTRAVNGIAVTPHGVYVADSGGLCSSWEGGLTLFRPRDGSYVHHRGLLFDNRRGPGPADYEPNTPLPCNYISALAWDGRRLWMRLGGQGRPMVAAPYTPVLGLWTYDGETWQDRRVMPGALFAIGSHVWYHVPAEYSRDETLLGGSPPKKLAPGKWFVVGADTDYEPQLFAGSAHLDELGFGVRALAARGEELAFAGSLRGYTSLLIYDKRTTRWKERTYKDRDPEGGFQSGPAACMLYDDDGRLWISSWYKGVECYDPETGESRMFDFGTEPPLPGSMALYGKYLIVSSEVPHPIVVLDTDSGECRKLDGVQATRVPAGGQLVIDGDSLWIVGSALTQVSLPDMIAELF